MIKINLLPQELSVNKDVVRLAKIIKNLNIAIMVVFIFFGVGLLIFLLFGSRRLSSLETKASDLETQIMSQQVIEQKVVLLKDRLVKIKMLDTTESAEAVLKNMEPVLAALPSDTTMGELSVDTKTIDMSIAFPSSDQLHVFFDSLESFDNFSKISLSNFAFNPATGYLVGFRFAQKL